MKNKILFPMFIESSKGGMQQIVLDLMTGLTTKGWECILVGYRDSELIEYFSKNGVHCISIDIPRTKIGHLSFIYQLYKIVKKEKANLLVVNDIFTHILLALYPFRKKELFVSHGGNYKSKGKEFAANSGNAARIAKHTFKRVTHFVAVSETQKNALVVNAGVDPVKVHTIVNGVKRPQTFEKGGGVTDVLNISIIGYIKKLKNQAVLLRAIKQLRDKGIRCRLNLFGSVADNTYYEEIKREMNELDLNDNVVFWGYVTDKKLIFDNSDIVVSCSYHEGFGLSLVEAMAYGKPTIAYAKSEGPSSIIENNKTGILVEENTSEYYTEAILRYYNNRDFTSRIIENANEVFDEKFSLESMVDSYEQIILAI